MSDPQTVSFDRASGFYDATRSLSAHAMALAMAHLVPELNGGRCLEIGVGTGRFALPLHDAGVDIFGLDVSSKMLARLVENSGGMPFPLIAGDATRAPFQDASFDSALGVHIFHLIPRWTEALEELIRVVRPGGSIVVDPGGWGRGSWKELQEIFCEGAGLETRHPGVNSPEELDEAMAERGATVRVLEEILETKRLTHRAIVKLLEDGIFSFTWRTDQVGRTRGADHLRAHLADRGIDLDDMMTLEMPILWRVYDL